MKVFRIETEDSRNTELLVFTCVQTFWLAESHLLALTPQLTSLGLGRPLLVEPGITPEK